MSGPCIRLRMEGQPQDRSEGAALLLVSVLKFCAQPETFPVFQAFTLADTAKYEWVTEIMTKLSPAVLRDVESMIAAAVVADLDGAA